MRSYRARICEACKEQITGDNYYLWHGAVLIHNTVQCKQEMRDHATEQASAASSQGERAVAETFVELAEA